MSASHRSVKPPPAFDPGGAAVTTAVSSTDAHVHSATLCSGVPWQ
jgi:hypothetical protein